MIEPMKEETKIELYELLVTNLNLDIEDLKHKNSMLENECKFLKEIIVKLTNFN